jgi:hypothetical protein
MFDKCILFSNINLDSHFLTNEFDDNLSPKPEKAPDKASAILKKNFMDCSIYFKVVSIVLSRFSKKVFDELCPILEKISNGFS